MNGKTANLNKGLSNTMTTLIILVVAVLLATFVTQYIVNVTMIRTETEVLQIKNPHIWVNSTGAIAAFKLQNVGGRDVLIDELAVNSVAVDWSDVYMYRLPENSTFIDELIVANYSEMTGSWFMHQTYNFSVVTSDISLKSGRIILVFIRDPSDIEIDDIGYPASLNAYTTESNYITWCNIESATTQ